MIFQFPYVPPPPDAVTIGPGGRLLLLLFLGWLLVVLVYFFFESYNVWLSEEFRSDCEELQSRRKGKKWWQF